MSFVWVIFAPPFPNPFRLVLTTICCSAGTSAEHDLINSLVRRMNAYNAATDYFRSRTSKQLHTAFRPSVETVMNEVGVNRQYNELMGRYQSVPFAQSIAFDVNQYVTEKATDGLFFVVAEEEKKIRTNPAARITDLLREVFGTRK
jgi:Protein of unknown function (DUF4197)